MKWYRPRNRNCHLTGPHNCCGQNRSKGKNWERGLQQEFPQLGRCGNSPCPERRACIASFSLMGWDLLFFLLSEKCRTLLNVWGFPLTWHLCTSLCLERGWPWCLSWVSAPLQMNLLQRAAATRACYCCCVISSSRHSCSGVLCPWWIIKPCTPVFQGVSYRSGY